MMFVLWRALSAMGSYISRCLPFQVQPIRFNQLKLQVVGNYSSQVVETSDRLPVEAPELSSEYNGRGSQNFLMHISIHSLGHDMKWKMSVLHRILLHLSV